MQKATCFFRRNIPDTLIIGLYHKIRIPFNSIKTTCTLLNKNMIDMLKETKNEKLDYEIELLNKIVWDISLVTNSTLKSEIINAQSVKDLKNRY